MAGLVLPKIVYWCNLAQFAGMQKEKTVIQ